MFKFIFFILVLINPLKVFPMVPPPGSGAGGHISREATNKVNPPGCSTNISVTIHRDGTKETRKTLICTEVTKESVSGNKIVSPKPGSNQDKRSDEIIDQFKKEKKINSTKYK